MDSHPKYTHNEPFQWLFTFPFRYIYPEYIESILSILWILLIETVTFLQRSSFKKIGNQLVLSFFIISRKNYLFKML